MTQRMNEIKKQYMMMYQEAAEAAAVAEEEYEQLRLSVLLPKSSPLDGPGRKKERTTDQSAYHAMLEEVYRKDVVPKQIRKMEIRKQIVNSIEELPTERERAIMRTRYLILAQTKEQRRLKKEGTRVRTWREVADLRGYSLQGATKIHGIALSHLHVPQDIEDQLRKSRQK